MKRIAEVSKKQFGAILTVLLISNLLVGVVFWNGGRVQASFTGSEESVPKYNDSTLPYSYIIDTNSTHYFMYNGTTWRKDASSTILQDIWNWAVTNTSNIGGGNVLFRDGNFTFADYDTYGNALLRSNVSVFGSGVGTVFYSSTTLDGWRGIIEASANPRIYNIRLSNFVLDGRGTDMGMVTAVGVWIFNTTNIEIDHVTFRNHRGLMLRLVGWNDPNHRPIYDASVHHCRFERGTYGGITANIITDFDISYNYFGVMDTAMEIGDNATLGTVSHNEIVNMTDPYGVLTNHVGISVIKQTTWYPQFITISDNTIRGRSGENDTRGGISVGGHDITLIGNEIYECSVQGISFTTTSLRCLAVGNRIYKSYYAFSVYGSYHRITANSIYLSGEHWDTVGAPTSYRGIWFGGATSKNNSATENTLIDLKGWSIHVMGANNTVKDNIIIDSDGSHGANGITVSNTGDSAVIEGNKVQYINNLLSIASGATNCRVQNNEFIGGSVSINDASTLIRWNEGYVTENSGKTTVANGENVAHGLAGSLVPTWGSVTSLNATYDSEPVIVALDFGGFDATNIQVNVYFANGTACTNDVIDIYWEARTWN